MPWRESTENFSVIEIFPDSVENGAIKSNDYVIRSLVNLQGGIVVVFSSGGQEFIGWLAYIKKGSKSEIN